MSLKYVVTFITGRWEAGETVYRSDLQTYQRVPLSEGWAATALTHIRSHSNDGYARTTLIAET